MENPQNVPFIVHESELCRLERITRRALITTAIMAAVTALTIAAAALNWI